MWISSGFCQSSTAFLATSNFTIDSVVRVRRAEHNCRSTAVKFFILSIRLSSSVVSGGKKRFLNRVPRVRVPRRGRTVEAISVQAGNVVTVRLNVLGIIFFLYCARVVMWPPTAGNAGCKIVFSREAHTGELGLAICARHHFCCTSRKKKDHL